MVAPYVWWRYSTLMNTNTIIAGDCLQILPAFPPESVDLVFADPPFNIGYSYDVCKDCRPRDEYLAWVDRWLAECVRVLKPAGAICVAIDAELAGRYQVKLEDAGLHYRNTVIWHYTFGPHLTAKFGRNHVPIFHFTRRRKRFTFNADAVRVASERQRVGDKRADPRGRVPGDVWEFPRVCGTFKERNEAGHNCQMPEKLLERIISAFTNAGDVVLDPFTGTGTTPAVAKKLGRRWIGVELSEDYAKAARERCGGHETGR